MSSDCAWDKEWWKKAKAASLERRKEKSRAGALARLGDSFLIVTEGTVTEPVYFEFLLRDLQLSVVRIRVQPGDASDPRHVIRCAEREAKEQVRKAKKGLLGIHEPSRFDHVWAVVDSDVAVRMGFWNDVEQLASSRKVGLAYSHPCFEYWILLHVAGFTTRTDLVDGAAAKRAVRDGLGRDYSTNEAITKEVIGSIIPGWPKAVGHAENVRNTAVPQRE